MSIFTFIVDYMGGTYLKQVVADDVESAIGAWVAGLHETDLGELRGEQIEHARMKLLNDTPGPITGLTSVWCIQARVQNHLMIVHIVEGK